MNKKTISIAIAIIIIIIIIILIILGIIIVPKIAKTPEQVACTMEAKLCPDGSYVGRTGPRCEFSACPENNDTGTWKTFTDEGQHVLFQYPEKFLTKYIHTVDWPPQIAISDDPFTCVEVGDETDRAGKTEKRMVNNRTYCVTKESEGAAGSIYTNYAYATARDGQVIILTFSLQAVQCGNYDVGEKAACEAEQASFDLDAVMDRIMQSVTFNFIN